MSSISHVTVAISSAFGLICTAQPLIHTVIVRRCVVELLTA